MPRYTSTAPCKRSLRRRTYLPCAMNSRVGSLRRSSSIMSFTRFPRKTCFRRGNTPSLVVRPRKKSKRSTTMITPQRSTWCQADSSSAIVMSMWITGRKKVTTSSCLGFAGCSVRLRRSGLDREDRKLPHVRRTFDGVGIRHPPYIVVLVAPRELSRRYVGHEGEVHVQPLRAGEVLLV